MKGYPIALLICIVCLLSSCDGCQKYAANANTSRTVNIVLCDLTRSIDTTSIDSIASHAGLLYRRSREHSQWYFYGIGGTDYNCRLGEYANEITGRMTKADMLKRSETLDGCADSVCFRIKEVYAQSGYKRTCITDALKTVYDKVREKRQDGDKAAVNLIILSDLVEDCPHSPLGDVRLDSRENYMHSMEVLDTTNISPFNLKAAGVKIFIVPESKNEHTKVSRDEMERAWRKIFNRYGYQSGDDADLTFTGLNSLPEHFAAR